MWYDRLQSRVEFLEDTLREMLRAFEAQIPVCPRGQTVADFTATWGPERRHELENNYVLRVETVSGRHAKGRREYFPPNLCGPKPNFYKSQHRFELPPDQTGQSLVAALDVWFHCCRWPSPEGMMLRQEMAGWAPSLLEGVCLLADAHEHSHMQQPVCFPPPLSKHPQLLKVQAALNAAFLRVDHDCADEIRVRAGGPPEPFDKEGFTTLPLIMFPGPAAICLTDPEVTLMHSNRKAWSEEVMAPVNSALKATSDPDCYLLDSIHPPSADKKQLLLLQRTIEFAVNEGGDVWNFVHQFLGRAICLMPILGVAPYLELYQALAHYVISYRLYTAEDMRAQSELVSPFLLGRFLILGPIQRYLGARPEAARRMLNEYSHGSLKFSTDWEFYQQLIRLWHRHLADSQAPYFPEQPSQRFPCAWQPPYFHEVPEYCGGGTVHGWPPFTMYAECKVTHPSHRDYYTAWQSAWSMGRLPDKPFDLYRCYHPRPANLTPPSEPPSPPASPPSSPLSTSASPPLPPPPSPLPPAHPFPLPSGPCDVIWVECGCCDLEGQDMFVNVTDHAVGVQSPSPDLPECRHPVCVSECRTWWAREKVVLLPKVDSACAEHSALAVSSSILHSVEHLDSELSIATTPAHHHTPPSAPPSEPPSPPASPPSSPLPTSAPPSLPPALSLLPPTETAAPQAIAAARRAQRFSVNCGESQPTVLSSNDFVVVEDTPVGPQPVTSAQFELVSPPLSAELASDAAPSVPVRPLLHDIRSFDRSTLFSVDRTQYTILRGHDRISWQSEPMPRRSYLNSHGEPTPRRFDLRCRPALEHALQRTICAFEHVELRPTFEFGRELLCPARYRRLRRVVHTTIAPRHVTASQASVQPCHAAAPRVPPRHPNRSPPPQSAGRHVPKSWRRSHMRQTASGGFATRHAGSSSKSSMRPSSKISTSSGRSSTASMVQSRVPPATLPCWPNAADPRSIPAPSSRYSDRLANEGRQDELDYCRGWLTDYLRHLTCAPKMTLETMTRIACDARLAASRSFDRDLADSGSVTRSSIAARAWTLGRQATTTGVSCQTTTTRDDTCHPRDREHHDGPLRPVWIVARNQCRRHTMLLAMIRAVNPFLVPDVNPDSRRPDDPPGGLHHAQQFHPDSQPTRSLTAAPAPFRLPGSSSAPCQDTSEPPGPTPSAVRASRSEPSAFRAIRSYPVMPVRTLRRPACPDPPALRQSDRLAMLAGWTRTPVRLPPSDATSVASRVTAVDAVGHHW